MYNNSDICVTWKLTFEKRFEADGVTSPKPPPGCMYTCMPTIDFTCVCVGGGLSKSLCISQLYWPMKKVRDSPSCFRCRSRRPRNCSCNCKVTVWFSPCARAPNNIRYDVVIYFKFFFSLAVRFYFVIFVYGESHMK